MKEHPLLPQYRKALESLIALQKRERAKGAGRNMHKLAVIEQEIAEVTAVIHYLETGKGFSI